MNDYTDDSLYKSIDDWGYGYVDGKNLPIFFRKNKYNATEPDIEAIIRRMDLDADGKLTFQELIQGITPQEPYAKLIIRERMKAQETQKKSKADAKEAIEKGKKLSKKQAQGEGEE